ncbi:type II secretion system protein GspM [Brevundimonas vesicularis]|uniref:type II secretion system protein GspM n=1 Tax=Brevundimonas vesicularis TaxID=41276 RepID=UPI003AF625BC
MVLLIAGVLIWLVVVRPMWSWREAAAERREEARITLLKVDAGVRRLSRDLGREGSKGSSADIEPVIRQSAEVAGLVVTTGMDPLDDQRADFSVACSAEGRAWAGSVALGSSRECGRNLASRWRICAVSNARRSREITLNPTKAKLLH